MRADQLQALIDCPEEVCACWFRNSKKWMANTLSVGCRLGDPTYNFAFMEQSIPMLQKEIKYVTFFGTGLTKVRKSMQTRPLERHQEILASNGFKGKNTDNAIIENMNSLRPGFWVRAHVHDEVVHEHP